MQFTQTKKAINYLFFRKKKIELYTKEKITILYTKIKCQENITRSPGDAVVTIARNRVAKKVWAVELPFIKILHLYQ